MKNCMVLVLLLLLSSMLYPQIYRAEGPLAHTFSIVARDEATGELGVAVQSHWFSVGSAVSWGEAGVGVVATQSFTNVSFGLRGLAMLKAGLTPQQALDSLLSDDDGRDFRQVAILDVKGRAAAYTGNKCIDYAGHLSGNNYSVQANLMLNDRVWPEMEKAFLAAKGPLAERMLTALNAGQAAGGDIRGKQSAAILIVKGVSSGKVWKDKLMDLRVEDSQEPLQELARLISVHRAYEHMNAGDEAVEKGDMKLAMEEYSTAESMCPGNEEMKYLHAVALANNGKLDEALIMFKDIFKRNENWRIVTPRLVKPGLLKVSDEDLSRILNER
jgi:uncharacterized Ntn-hydrolase superfamily protein